MIEVKERSLGSQVASWRFKIWCLMCGASKGPRTHARPTMKKYNVGFPFERIAIVNSAQKC